MIFQLVKVMLLSIQINQLEFLQITLHLFNKMNESDQMHREEVNTLKETIAQNTNVLAQLKQLLEDKFND